MYENLNTTYLHTWIFAVLVLVGRSRWRLRNLCYVQAPCFIFFNKLELTLHLFMHIFIYHWLFTTYIHIHSLVCIFCSFHNEKFIVLVMSLERHFSCTSLLLLYFLISFCCCRCRIWCVCSLFAGFLAQIFPVIHVYANILFLYRFVCCCYGCLRVRVCLCECKVKKQCWNNENFVECWKVVFGDFVPNFFFSILSLSCRHGIKKYCFGTGLL